MNNVKIAVNIADDQELLISIESNDYRMEDPASALERQRIPQDFEMCLKAMEKAYKVSGKQAADVIRLRFGLGGNLMPMTLNDIAKLMGLSRERIRQIEERALLWLRRYAAKFGMIELRRMPSQTFLTPPWEVRK